MHKRKISSVAIALLVTTCLVIVGALVVKEIRTIGLALTNEKTLAEIRLKEVAEMIQDKDKEALRDELSKKAKEEDTEFEDHLDTFFRSIQGEVQSWKCATARSEGKIDGRKKEKMVCAWCSVTTDHDVYILYFEDYVISTIDPDKAGLSGIVLVQKSAPDTYMVKLGKQRMLKQHAEDGSPVVPDIMLK